MKNTIEMKNNPQVWKFRKKILYMLNNMSWKFVLYKQYIKNCSHGHLRQRPLPILIMDTNYQKKILNGQIEQDKIRHLAFAIVSVVESIIQTNENKCIKLE